MSNFLPHGLAGDGVVYLDHVVAQLAEQHTILCAWRFQLSPAELTRANCLRSLSGRPSCFL